MWNPGMGDSLAPPGFVPKRVKRRGSYEDIHPTRYGWEPHVDPLIRKLYRRMGGPPAIHVNTYDDHPPDEQRPRRWPVGFYDKLSLDVWAGAGRNAPIGHAKGQQAFNLIWNDPGRPYIDWLIWERVMYLRNPDGSFSKIPYGTDPFSFHDDHVHVTFKPRLWVP